ncbi:hypothetical protein [Endozoicomonas sp. GU-1]|uniref:hypothetical protein n=1 Tax=Endozoicomonas sp. GU-1 TaxID=3009078 RepID=UPI0022B314E8|nr:hypothetical protein [Endozoicomonas sp. GU-1]WBA80893.1 hypothetical protein O2T12_21710 [Endozoicomonas sp. GU-1]WBA88456.1 hypothetical protein O3276_10895 [Endozoicomonas sp. GU-1]
MCAVGWADQLAVAVQLTAQGAGDQGGFTQVANLAHQGCWVGQFNDTGAERRQLRADVAVAEIDIHQ